MSNNHTNERTEKRTEETSGAWRAVPIYVGVSFLAALVFWAVTTFTGSYPLVARFGGAIWIFILMMIVLMPIVIPRLRNR